MLKAGYVVAYIPEAYVIHHGFRTWAEARVQTKDAGFGMGAAYMKHLRLGDLAIVPTLVISWVCCISWKRLLLLRGRTGVAFFLAYARGMLASFPYQIDRRTRTYLPSGRAVHAADADAPQAKPVR
jgi:hypothetical protein